VGFRNRNSKRHPLIDLPSHGADADRIYFKGASIRLPRDMTRRRDLLQKENLASIYRGQIPVRVLTSNKGLVQRLGVKRTVPVR